MTPYRFAFRHLTLTSAMVLLSVASAHALDTEAFGNRLKAYMTEQGTEINWTGINESGTQIVLTGVTMGAPGSPQNVGDIALDNVTEENGGYRIGTLTLPEFSRSEQGMDVTVTGLSVEGLTIPGEGAQGLPFMMGDKVDLENYSVKKGESEVFSMQQLHVEVTPAADGKPMEISGAAESFSADLSQIEDPQSKAAIEALGYQNIKGSIEMASSWQPTDGRVGVSQYDITVENAGTLGLTFDFAGLTPDFIKKMQEMQKQPAGGDNSGQAMAAFGMMQQLTFHSASIRWDDDSLTQKVIEFVAKQSGQKPEDIVAQAKATLPMMMAMGGITDPDFVKGVTDAIDAYLTESKNLEITAEPGNGVPFAVIMAGGMSNPPELLKTLGVSVTANQE